MGWTTLHRAARLFVNTVFDRLINPSLSELNNRELSGVQFACLRFLLYNGPVSAKGVARALRITPAAATKLMDRLVRKGLITRRSDELDRRRVEISLTPEGSAVVSEIVNAEEARFQEIVGRMSEEEVSALKVGLTAFLRAGITDAATLDRVCLRCGETHAGDCPGQLIAQELQGRNTRKT